MKYAVKFKGGLNAARNVKGITHEIEAGEFSWKLCRPYTFLDERTRPLSFIQSGTTKEM